MATDIQISAASNDIPTVAEYAMITDFDSGRVLLEKNKDLPMKPASMAKIMTVYIVFSRIAEGNLALDDQFIVSEKAWKMGGSRSFLKVGESYTLETLLNGVVVQSGNDAAVVIAEGLSGSEDSFASEMNDTARQLGMNNTHFTNSTGWPDPDLTTTAADLNILATRLIKDFPAEIYPNLYPMFVKKTYTINDIKQGNRNPLLYSKTATLNGVDGLKTGFTEESGYGLVASAKRQDQRVIMVLNGIETKKERASEASRLINFILREFSNYKFFLAGEQVDRADVWLGTAQTVPLVIEADLRAVLSRSERKNAQVKVSWVNPIPAPINKGQKLGDIMLMINQKTVQTIPLIAGDTVKELGVFDRLMTAFNYLIFGHSLTPVSKL